KLYTARYRATTEQIREAINSGRSLIIYSGHGSTTSWVDGPEFTQRDVRNLSNTNLYPFVCSHACLTGKFNFWECFGETWVRVKDGGAVAFWGSSAPTMWTEDDLLEKYMFSMWWDKNFETIGGMTTAALEELYTHYGGGKNSKYYMECYNLLGDPSLKPWRSNPLTADFSFKQIHNDNNFTIQFYDDSYGCINYIRWNFGDGNTSMKRNPIHKYPRKEVYTVTLIVENKDGNIDDITQVIAPISIVYPENGLYIFGRKILDLDRIIVIGPLKIIVEPYIEGGIDYMEFLVDDELKGIVSQHPFTWIWDEKSFDKHTIKVIAHKGNGTVFDTVEDVMVINI
ncbi:MAG TPA: PKD domain-containing protein, partial [Thermoplasmatales archaeon]|nr:PKD domain-containing protein [Thermoplasmatales archaeon]